MTVKLESSAATTLVWCTRCPSFRELASDRSEGHDIAVAHEDAVHPESRVAEINRYKFLEAIRASRFS